jgi:hypothetical protein
MRRDPVRAMSLRQKRRRHRVRMRAAARVPYGGDMVYVHAQADHLFVPFSFFFFGRKRSKKTSLT